MVAHLPVTGKILCLIPNTVKKTLLLAWLHRRMWTLGVGHGNSGRFSGSGSRRDLSGAFSFQNIYIENVFTSIHMIFFFFGSTGV
jgi:hypothetical protein